MRFAASASNAVTVNAWARCVFAFQRPGNTADWSIVWVVFLEMRAAGSGVKMPPVCSWYIENSTGNGACVKIPPL